MCSQVAQLGSASLQELAGSFCLLTGFDAQRVGAGAVLLTLGHSSYAERNPDYGVLVRAGVERFVERGRSFFFKYHPREAASDYLGLAALPAAQQVPRTLPVECLYLLAQNRPLVVVGGMSTALLTAGLLMPQARIAALVHASNAGDAWDAALLAALRIAPLHDALALEAYVNTPPA